MKTYETYKDSGVEWIGMYPSEWTFMSVRRITDDHKQGYYSPGEYKQDGYKLVRITDLDSNGNIDTSKSPFVHPTDKELEVFELRKGDVLFPRTGSIGLIGVATENMKAVFASYLIRFRFNSKVDNTFIRYFFISDSFLNGLFSDLHGGVNQNIHAENIKDQFLVLPTIQEQTQIANYLNHKTAQLDTLIAKKEQLICLLQEERTAMINQAVTKGLDPNVAMRDSGIGWLGEIPEHWQAKNIKYVSTLRSGDNIISEQINSEGSYPVYGGNGLRGYYSEYTNDGNYILIGRQGALCGNIKYASDKFWASEHAIVCYLNSNHNWIWFGKLLEAMDLNQYNQSAAQPGLAVGLIKNLKIPTPSFKEQLKIVDFISDFEEKTDTLMNKYQQEIDLLKEYKTALINEVVTGKVDVREEVLH